MKTTLFTLLIIISSICNAQTIDSTVSRKKFGTMDCKFMKTTEETGEVRYSVFCSYQNAEYSTITDIGSLLFMDKEHLDSFIVDLESAYNLMMNKSRENATYKRDRYSLVLYDFAATTLYIYDDHNKKTTMPRRLVAEWLEWLKSIKFP
jgi:hypothetical protein